VTPVLLGYFAVQPFKLSLHFWWYQAVAAFILSAILIAGPAQAVDTDSIGPAQGLVFLDKHEASAQADRGPCLVLVPGLLASDNSMACFWKESQKRSFATAIFRYTSQDGICAASEALARDLRRLKAESPNRTVVIVTHSMGGLVARRCLEDPSLSPGNVTQLIMIAPPNQGSALAKFTAAEIAEDFRFKETFDKQSLALIDDALGSFFGRAKEDLCPGSDTLTKLNACGRANGIRYCIIAGNAGPIPGEIVSVSLLVSGLFFGEDPDTTTALQSASKLLTLEEWTQGRGDGVVSVNSTKLKGVDDFITLPFTHNSFGEETCEATDSVLREVMKRVEQSR
jgi:predicted alpha/beta hydrolase family esterase